MFRRVCVLLGLSILSVVITHGSAFGLWALYAWTDRYKILLPPDFNPFQTPQWFALIFIKQIFSFCVPAFFFVSGFFIAYTVDKESRVIKSGIVKRRVFSLLIPYIIWTIISLALATVVSGPLSLPEYIWPFFGIGGYWFIPPLIIFYLLSNWFVKLAYKNWKGFLLILVIVQFLLIVLSYLWFANFQYPILRFILSDNFEILVFNYLFYFPFGIVVGLNIEKFKVWLTPYRRYFVPPFFLILFVDLYLFGWTKVAVDQLSNSTHFIVKLNFHLYSILFLLLFLLYENVKIPFSNWLIKLGGMTYGIYLTHFLFMTYFSKFVYHFFPTLLYYQFLFAMLIITVGLVGSIILMNMVKKIPIKGFYRWLFG